MIELFSDIFTFRENVLTRADSRVKLIAAMFAISLALLSDKPYFAACLFVISAASAAPLRLPWKSVAARFMMPFGAVCVLCALQMFMTAGTPVWSLPVLHFSLVATREGISNAIHIGARVMGAMSVVVLLGITTPAHEIFRALLWMKAPVAWVEIGMLMYRYVFVLLDSTVDMATAQMLRLGYSDTRKAMRSAGVLSGAVILRSIDQAAKTNDAMMLRGYSGKLPVGRLSPFARRDAVIAASICAALFALFAFFKWGAA